MLRRVTIPSIGDFHGKASWAVRTIWEEYSGWFHYDSTTSLYGVPRSSVDADLVALAGGDALAKRAAERVAASSLWIDDTASPTVLEIRAKGRAFRARADLQAAAQQQLAHEA